MAKVPARRLWIVFLILCSGLTGLIGRMAWLQLVQTGDLEARARRLQTQTRTPLARNTPVPKTERGVTGKIVPTSAAKVTKEVEKEVEKVEETVEETAEVEMEVDMEVEKVEERAEETAEEAA